MDGPNRRPALVLNYLAYRLQPLLNTAHRDTPAPISSADAEIALTLSCV